MHFVTSATRRRRRARPRARARRPDGRRLTAGALLLRGVSCSLPHCALVPWFHTRARRAAGRRRRGNTDMHVQNFTFADMARKRSMKATLPRDFRNLA